MPEGPKLITFTVEGYDQPFTAEEGMNWVDFCASAYNTEEWYCDNDGSWIWLYDEGSGWTMTSYFLNDTSSEHIPIGEDLIKADNQYTSFSEGGVGGGWG